MTGTGTADVPNAIEISGLHKEFGHTKALGGLDLTVLRRRALLGTANQGGPTCRNRPSPTS